MSQVISIHIKLLIIDRHDVWIIREPGYEVWYNYVAMSLESVSRTAPSHTFENGDLVKVEYCHLPIVNYGSLAVDNSVTVLGLPSSDYEPRPGWLVRLHTVDIAVVILNIPNELPEYALRIPPRPPHDW